MTTQSLDATTFDALGVPAALSAVLADRGITHPTPIQAATLPDSLAGRDVLGRGRTGSGKTYAFLLPLVARLAEGRSAAPRRPRALILAPTRELVGQIHAALAAARRGRRPDAPSPSSAASARTPRSPACARAPTSCSPARAGSRT